MRILCWAVKSDSPNHVPIMTSMSQSVMSPFGASGRQGVPLRERRCWVLAGREGAGGGAGAAVGASGAYSQQAPARRALALPADLA
jgi:hypothetical protein